MKSRSGFTLVEILIVVVILGILAAIVIPQFTGASTEAKEASLMSNLQAMRAQIELYKIQHSDLLPGETTGVDFATALTSKTNSAGAEGSTTAHRFGPYMREIPENPFNNLATVGTGITALAAGGTTYGWYFVTEGTDEGLFQAADDGANVVTTDLHVTY